MKRTTRAFFCLAIGLVSGLGTALAGTTQEISPSLPTTFQVVPPLDGDFGAYNLTTYHRSHGEWVANASAEDFRFLHRFHPWILDGQPVLLAEAAEFHHGFCSINEDTAPEYESDLFLPNWTTVGHGSGCSSFGTSPITDDSAWGKRQLSVATEDFVVNPHDARQRMNAEFCGHLNAFQKGPVDVVHLPPLFARCGFTIDNRFPPPSYRALGTAAFNGEQALVVEGRVTYYGQLMAQAQWWFVRSIAYPVRMTIEHGEILKVWDLAKFQPGTSPPPVPAVAPPLLRASWGFQGPREDVPHAFLLSQAIAAARAAPDYEGFRDFLAAYPTAVVQEARYRFLTRDDAAHTEVWDFVLADGHGNARQFSVDRSNGPPAWYPAEIVLHGQHMDRPDGLPSYQYQDYDAWKGRPPSYPTPDHLPPVPTVGSLQALYSALTSHAANAWGITYRVDGPLLSVGEEHENSTSVWNDGDVLYGSGNHDMDFSHRLMVSPEGAPIEWHSYDAQDDYGPDLQPSQPQEAPLAFQLGATEAGTVWAWRFGAAAATTSLLGFAAALLYWFWPTIKTSAVGLFSRITDADVPNHPSRQRILKAITDNPGIHLRELANQAGMSMGTLRHHLAKLEASQQIQVERHGAFVCHYLPGQARDAAPQSTQSAGYQSVQQAQHDHPRATIAELARLTGLAESTVRYHLRRLQAFAPRHP